MNFPRTIWMYWHQGFDQAPNLVKQCVISWQKYHKDWDIKLLNKNTIDDYMSPIPLSTEKLDSLKLAHRSDLIRTQLLVNHGGVWIDPTCFCVKPLDEWLHGNPSTGIFMFYRPGRDRIISNWFIASEKGNPLLKELLNDLCEYWENNNFLNMGGQKIWYEPWLKKICNRSLWSTQLWFIWFTRKILKLYPYMVYHYMFYQLVSNDKEARDIWESTPKLYSSGPHSLQRIGLLNAINNEIKLEIDGKVEPLYKLTWKMKNKSIPEGSVLEYLLHSND